MVSQVFVGQAFPQLQLTAPTPSVVRKVNALLPTCGLLFPFAGALSMGGAAQPTAYWYEPTDIMVLGRGWTKALAQIITHEMMHYVWMRYLTAADRARIAKICAVNPHVDPAEQHAVAGEYAVHGTSARLEHKAWNDVDWVLVGAMTPWVKPYVTMQHAPPKDRTSPKLYKLAKNMYGVKPGQTITYGGRPYTIAEVRNYPQMSGLPVIAVQMGSKVVELEQGYDHKAQQHTGWIPFDAVRERF